MGAGISDLEVNEMIAEVDEEHTGRIQYADFVKYVTLSVTHSFSHSLTHSLTPSVTPSFTHFVSQCKTTILLHCYPHTIFLPELYFIYFFPYLLL
jgi:hypothetical protein